MMYTTEQLFEVAGAFWCGGMLTGCLLRKVTTYRAPKRVTKGWHEHA